MLNPHRPVSAGRSDLTRRPIQLYGADGSARRPICLFPSGLQICESYRPILRRLPRENRIVASGYSDFSASPPFRRRCRMVVAMSAGKYIWRSKTHPIVVRDGFSVLSPVREFLFSVEGWMMCVICCLEPYAYLSPSCSNSFGFSFPIPPSKHHAATMISWRCGNRPRDAHGGFAYWRSNAFASKEAIPAGASRRIRAADPLLGFLGPSSAFPKSDRMVGMDIISLEGWRRKFPNTFHPAPWYSDSNRHAPFISS